MSSPAPKSPELSEKNRKYDRQLRLWGDNGQTSLEAAHICVINATALGSEILKSLVLAGIGAFTIVDEHKITHEDTGANFFLDVDGIGKSRAQVATEMLVELNADVRGDYIDEGPEGILCDGPGFFDNFAVVVATDLPEKSVLMLSRKLWDLNVPLIVCRSIGFVGYMRVQVREHAIVETHPDNQLPDLRLDKPFESLKRYFDSIDLDSMDLKDHSHTPYVVVLYKHLEKLMKVGGGGAQSVAKAKLRELVREGMRKDEEGLPVGEENFEEAIRAVNTSIGTSVVPQSVMDILNDDSCVNLTAKSSQFWIIAKAVRDFMENEGEGLLPVRGSLPDMTADTEKYVALQQIYRKQALADVEAVWRRTCQLLRQLGRSSDSISENDVKLFCRHAAHIHVERGTCIADEYDPKTINANDIAQSLENPDSMLIYYVLLRGLDKFQAEYNSFPGEFDDHVEPDIVKLKACVSKLLTEWGCCGGLSKDDYVHEFCRFGGCQLHSVSAFLGGLAAQEAIKFITSQYKPIHNTFIHDAVTCNSATFFF